MNDKTGKEITATVIARLLMLSERRVQQLAREKWIPRPYTFPGAVQGYIRFLQDEQRKTSRTADEAAVRRERARRLKLANDQDERLLVPIDDVMAFADAVFGPVKSDLAGIPARFTDDIRERRRLENLMDDVLGELSRRFRQAGDDLSAGRDALGAVGEDDSERMGEKEPEISSLGGAAGAT